MLSLGGGVGESVDRILHDFAYVGLNCCSQPEHRVRIALLYLLDGLKFAEILVQVDWKLLRRSRASYLFIIIYDDMVLTPHPSDRPRTCFDRISRADLFLRAATFLVGATSGWSLLHGAAVARSWLHKTDGAEPVDLHPTRHATRRTGRFGKEIWKIGSGEFEDVSANRDAVGDAERDDLVTEL